MGCDIHCYIEYKNPGWTHFGGRINPGRNYDLFAKLAGVRGEEEPVVKPRGYPRDAAWAAEGDHWIFITDGVVEDGCCTPEMAERYISLGSRYQDETRRFVSNPDWHSHSWLTPDEYEQAIEGWDEPAYIAILAALRSFEASGHEARLVFWFDN